MRVSQYFLVTYKESPSDAELISHQLMMRAGLIRKLGSGLYSWLPLGLKVLRNIESILREEMNRAGALEVLLPSVQPAELWEESGRWDQFGPQLLKFKDRHDRDFCYGPTHEEVITDCLRNELKSYKQLPLNLYQIQTKFRDEIRPRFGVMRAREFVMKDAYSFHTSPQSLADTYDDMFSAYTHAFTRMGLEFRSVLADTGSIGGSASHEFQVLADSGEDCIFYSNESQYAANVELAEAVAPTAPRAEPTQAMAIIDTPNVKTIDGLVEFMNVPITQTLKALVVHGSESDVVLLIVRGDHTLNAIKAEKLAEVASPLTFASDAEITKAFRCSPGFLGPVELDASIPVIVDHSAAHCSDFICGANQDHRHYQFANWERDANYTRAADIRNVVEGDPSPDGKGTLQQCRGIEVGHIFQLGTKYAEAMKASVLDESGKAVTLHMGCYGIGVSRIIAAAIEQNHDERGIIWPTPIAPFQLAIVPVNMHKSEKVKQAADALYQQCLDAGLEVLLDDRKERAGVMFADMDLIGIPHRVVISDRGLDAGTVEYKYRRDTEPRDIEHQTIVDFLQQQFT